MDSIVSLLREFEHPPAFEWIRGHSGIKGNERADALARAASQLHSISSPPPTQSLTASIPYVLHQANRPTGRYAAKVIKTAFRNQIRQTTQTRLAKRWSEWTSTINFNRSCKITSAGLGTGYHLDSVNYRQRAFRSKLLYRTLPVQSMVSTWAKYSNTSSLCPRCHSADETIEHIFLCTHTVSLLPDLLHQASSSLQVNKRSKITYKAISHTSFPAPASQMMEALVCSTPNFLQSPLCKGLVDQSSVADFTALLGLPYALSNSHLWFSLALDGWLSSFYHHVWKARNDLVFR